MFWKLGCLALTALLLPSLASARPWGPHRVLGVPQGASLPEIKKAYLKAALQWHPDKNSDPEAEARFIEITDAYRSLTGGDTGGHRRHHHSGRPATSGRRAEQQDFGEEEEMDLSEALKAALRTFATAFGLEDLVAQAGSIDWDKLASSTGALVEQAGTAAKQAVKARYLEDTGTVKWKTVLGDAAVAGAALLSMLSLDGDDGGSASAPGDEL